MVGKHCLVFMCDIIWLQGRTDLIFKTIKINYCCKSFINIHVYIFNLVAGNEHRQKILTYVKSLFLAVEG